MPYPKDHKARTRRRIVRSAQRLFAAGGFDATTIEAIMRDCRLTRGGFYAHFRSKAQLYAEAIGHAPPIEHSAPQPTPADDTRWLDDLFDSATHAPSADDAVRDPWQLLATDAASASPEVRSAYGRVLERLAQRLHHGSGRRFGADGEALAAAALIVGALAVARSIDDRSLARRVVEACRERAHSWLGRHGHAARQEFLWAVDASDLRASLRPLH